MKMSLGAWWPEGRSSSSVFQFLPSCSWSACQMAVNRKDGYRGELSLWWFLQLCFCSVWGRCPAERGEQTLRCAQLSARLIRTTRRRFGESRESLTYMQNWRATCKRYFLLYFPVKITEFLWSFSAFKNSWVFR